MPELAATVNFGGGGHKITAVESDEDIAAIYQAQFPGDEMVVGDALEFVEKHLTEFDFIWASPPCQTHSVLNIPTHAQTNRLPHIPDDKSLYGLIRWLKKWIDPNQLFIVENVKDYLGYLIQPNSMLARHPVWSNFPIPKKHFNRLKDMDHKSWKQLCEWHKIDQKLIPKTLSWEKNHDKRRTILRNCVDYKIGKYILDCAVKPKQRTLF